MGVVSGGQGAKPAQTSSGKLGLKSVLLAAMLVQSWREFSKPVLQPQLSTYSRRNPTSKAIATGSRTTTMVEPAAKEKADRNGQQQQQLDS